MPGDMIARVMQAMRDTGCDCCDWDEDALEEIARAAILEMREPTAALWNAGHNANIHILGDHLVSVYRVIIDEALK